jgi:hypothetical protein
MQSFSPLQPILLIWTLFEFVIRIPVPKRSTTVLTGICASGGIAGAVRLGTFIVPPLVAINVPELTCFVPTKSNCGEKVT